MQVCDWCSVCGRPCPRGAQPCHLGAHAPLRGRAAARAAAHHAALLPGTPVPCTAHMQPCTYVLLPRGFKVQLLSLSQAHYILASWQYRHSRLIHIPAPVSCAVIALCYQTTLMRCNAQLQAWRNKVAQQSVRPRNARHSAQHLLLTTGAQLSGHITSTAGGTRAMVSLLIGYTAPALLG